jgi:SecD/SecF fusion protein
MQNKGAIKFLAIILAIACAYQLSFTLVTKNVEKKALSYPKGEQAYLD